jgi:outer membrane lipoprotein SlyB
VGHSANTYDEVVLSFLGEFIMRVRLLALSCLVLASSWSEAQTTPPRSQYDIDSKLALTRYQEDQKVCKDVPDSGARLQCYRDAKSEYDRAMTAAKAKRDASSSASSTRATPVSSCPDCARVVSVSVIEREGEPSALGTIAGGIAGALLGHQIGGGSGQDLATVAGAAGGAYAGRQIEKKVSTHKAWMVSVQFPDGSRAEHEYSQDPGLRVGDLVRKTDQGFVRPAP